MEQNSTRRHSSAGQEPSILKQKKQSLKLYIGYAWINKVERMLSTS